MKRILIDAAHAEETRVVLLDGARIEDFESESSGKQQHKGNIYIGHVSRVEPSLQAAFITYGGNRNGFLAFAEVHPQYFTLKSAEKAALLEDLAEQAARRRGEDTDEADLDQSQPTQTAEPTGRHQRTTRGRPQRVDAGPATEAVAPAEAFSPAPIDLGNAAVASAEPFAYADAEDAAAARKAAAMVDEMANAAETGAPRTAGKGGGQRGRKPAQRGQARGHTGGQAGEGRSNNREAAGKRRPKRLNARRPERMAESPAEGTVPPVAAPATPAVASEGRSNDRARGPVHRRYRIQDVLKEGQKILVQVVKEERGSKGAALTTYVSLPGRYTVLMPNSPSAGGISRKITDFDERRMLRDTYRALAVPATMGLIIRTAGMGQEIEAIKADYGNLQQLWSHITQKFDNEADIQCLHEDGSIIVRALRDMAGQEIEEITISGQRAYKQAKDFSKAFMPETLKKIALYKEEAPIFSHYKVESKLLQLHHERVQLPSGGSIVINPTEALVAIDINSGRNTSERNIEETAYKTNLEATEEIARQIRLRDLAGLIVVDFIDMENFGNARKIEQAMRRALKRDRARIQAASISEFGLMEISRQRLRPSFAETHTIKCPHCNGTGLVVSPSASGLMLLRRLEEEDCVGADRITVAAATQTVLWVLNHKRELIRTLEEKYKYLLLFKADDSLLAPDAHLELTRVKADGTESSSQVAVELREQPEVPPEKRYTKEGRAQRQREDELREELKQADAPTPRDEPATRPSRPNRPSPQREERATAPAHTKATGQVTEPKQPGKQPVVATPAKTAKAIKPVVAKPPVEVADQPLAVQKVQADTSDSPVVAPSQPKAKFALKQQADTDRDISPVAVAQVKGDSSQEKPAKQPARKKTEKGLLNRLLGL